MLQSQGPLPGEQTTSLSDTLAEANPSIPAVKIVAGIGAGRIVPIPSSVLSIGRGTENDLVIEDLGISRVHCKIVRQDTRVYLQDCDSTNGTRVGGSRIRSTELKNGTLILLGNRVKLRFLWMDQDEQQLESQLVLDATVDASSGAMSKAAWTKAIGEWMQSSTPAECCVALARLDCLAVPNLDPSVREEVLLEFVRQARGLGKNLLIGRWDGEQFGLFFQGLSPQTARKRLERFQRDFIQTNLWPDAQERFYNSLSLGISGLSGHKLEDHLQNAAVALSQCRTLGENALLVGPTPEDDRLRQRRTKSRVQCRFSLKCIDPHTKDAFDVQVLDMGINGLRIRTSKAVGLLSELKLFPPNKPDSVVRLLITWSRDSGLAGGRFVEDAEALRLTWVPMALQSLGLTAESTQERRQELRIQAQTAVILTGQVGSYTTRLLNLGPNGLGVEGPLVPPVGQSLQVQLAEFRAPARVVWTKPPRCGLEFEPLSQSQSKQLDSLLRKAVLHTQGASKSPS